MQHRAPIVAVATAISASTALAANYALQPISGAVNAPMAFAPLGDGRELVLERRGTLRIIQDGVVLPGVYADFSSLVDSGAERAAFGLAVAPDFATTGNVYVSYTRATDGDMVVARLTASSPSAASIASAPVTVYDTGSGRRDYHNGGWIGFKPGDAANLYLTTGDGEDTSLPQDLSSTMGKVLRMNVSGSAATPSAGNPFLSTPGANPYVWASGLRSPSRASFDRATGDFYIGDVGDFTREEVDRVAASSAGGDNFGWPIREGNGANPSYAGPAAAGPLAEPIFSYDAGVDFPSGPGLRGCITGGYVYRGTDVPALYGAYVFADYDSGFFGALRQDPATGLWTDVADLTPELGVGSLFRERISAFGEDENGELLANNLWGNAAYALVPEPATVAPALLAALSLARRLRRR